MDVRLVPIETAAQLPAIGAAYETRMFDMKSVPNKNSIENAKDIAAFSNAHGGIILVGVHEDSVSGSLLRYNPLSDREAKKARDEYEQANQNLCSPVPVIDARIIPITDGYVLAVTVWPFPGQIVGIKLISSKESHGKELTTWAFPIRQGTQTDYLRPEQTAMLMSPEIRKIAALLSRIPMRVGTKVCLAFQVPKLFGPSENNGRAFKTNILDIDIIDYSIMDNVISIKMHHGDRESRNQQQTQSFSIPLDAVRTIWKQDEAWFIAITGTVEVSLVNSRTAYMPFVGDVLR